MPEIHKKLSHLLGAIAGSEKIPASSTLIEILQELDQIKSEYKDELDPQMLHYLERRSYEKAYAYLNNPGMPHTP